MRRVDRSRHPKAMVPRNWDVGRSRIRNPAPVPWFRPLLADLAREYSTRYHRVLDDVHFELREYLAERFAAPDGGLLLLVRDGRVVAGGAFQRYDEETAELKRIWTHRAHRGRGSPAGSSPNWRPKPRTAGIAGSLFGVVAGFLLGTVLALTRISRNPLLRAVSWTYTWIFRSVPLILQLLSSPPASGSPCT